MADQGSPSVLFQAVVDGKPDDTARFVDTALQAGQNPNDILAELIDGIRQVGDLFGTGEYFLPDLLLGAKAMKAGLARLEPALASQPGGSEVQSKGKVLLGTVKGDLHDIGKSLVGLMLDVNGFEVRDIGVDVPAERFIEEATNWQPDVIGMSSLLTTTAINMGSIIKALTEAGIRDKYFIVVGGAATTPAFAESINADGWAENATDAVKLVNKLLEVKASRIGGS